MAKALTFEGWFQVIRISAGRITSAAGPSRDVVQHELLEIDGGGCRLLAGAGERWEPLCGYRCASSDATVPIVIASNDMPRCS
ncbi:hypothetical protein QP150_01410 [Sphingomonas sp. 22L2VL55-3]